MSTGFFMGNLSIPAGTAEIRARAYDGNTKIRSVTVPGSVKKIGDRAFADCVNLQKITLCEGVEEIGSNVFTGCKRLRTLVLPASVRKITGWTFWGSGLKDPVFADSGRKLVFCPPEAAGSVYRVPEGVREIGVQAFAELKELRQVILPEGLEVIRERAFIACGFQKIVLPKSLRLVESGGFYGCQNLREITGIPAQSTLEKAKEFWRMQGRALAVPCMTRMPSGDRYWKEPAFRALAKRCAEADPGGMWEMAGFFRSKAQQRPEEAFFRRAENFWTYRAHQYGSGQAAALLEEWVQAHPGQRLPIPQLTSTLGGVMRGEMLNALGFLAFEEEQEYSFYQLDPEGVVLVSVYDSEDGPDEDGFGSETYYNWWYMDGCLNEIPGAPVLHSYSSIDRDSTSGRQRFREAHDQAAAFLRKRRE